MREFHCAHQKRDDVTVVTVFSLARENHARGSRAGVYTTREGQQFSCARENRCHNRHYCHCFCRVAYNSVTVEKPRLSHCHVPIDRSSDCQRDQPYHTRAHGERGQRKAGTGDQCRLVRARGA